MRTVLLSSAMAQPGWRKSLLPILLIFTLGAPSGAGAITKCLGSGGRIMYTNVSCPEGFSPVGADHPAAQAELSSPAPSGPSRPSFLWSVRGSQNSVYLLGTLHLVPTDLYPLGEAIEQAYWRSAIVVFEVDPAAGDDPARQARLLADGMYHDGTTVGEHLSHGARELLWRRVTEAGLSRAQVARLKPWLCTLVVTEATLRRAGINPDGGIDRHFLSRSRTDGKKPLFLETAAFQLDLLASLNESLQEPFLVKVLGDLDQVQGLYAQVVRLWRNGDAGGLAALLEPGAKRFPPIHERFVLERNRRWLQRVTQFLGLREDVLVVVGAAHLAGPDGLVSLLRAAGHAVEQR